MEATYMEASIRREVGGHVRRVAGIFPDLKWADSNEPVPKDIRSWLSRAKYDEEPPMFMGLRITRYNTMDLSVLAQLQSTLRPDEKQG